VPVKEETSNRNAVAEEAKDERGFWIKNGRVHFDAAHKAVHYPPDRRFYVWVRPSILMWACAFVIALIVAAWVQTWVSGLPYIPPVPQVYPSNFAGPHGFPWWVRFAHFFNFLFVMLLIRSGLSILYDHPRLYFNNDCTPGSEWLRVTPIKVPKDRLWTAKDDARYISPWFGLPGYRHTIGVARIWHFINVHGFIITGFIFVGLLLSSEQWRRIVPTSSTVLLQGWNVWVHYATLNLPPEPNGFYGYNALQQIAYFAVVFVMGPLAILTGIAMSPAIVNRFPWYAKLFGGRQSARSIHFLNMLGFVGFIIVHVTLIVMTGFVRNMNHIVTGTDNPFNYAGVIWGFVGIAVVILTWIVAHYVSWGAPRALQHAAKVVTYSMQLITLNKLAPSQNYTDRDISPFFWPNGKMPTRSDWKHMAEDGFRNYRLKVGGLVENPVELSIADLEELERSEHITLHHCIQGWTGIAQWGGIPVKALIDLVRPKPEVKTVVFYSFGEALYGGPYYETQSMENVLKPECQLAFRMNGEPLPLVYGAPLRLRAENQLGYKMIKGIERIDIVKSEKEVGAGEGGSNEDHEYFDLIPNI
jgi:DMSO/TMAO reductase YedYZ molybdopterin-dependent catalytic subunit/thiosulfate reductase cytochrome b subunit